jgi:crotonobetainyl-CoA:carnitine CoA-transferase CaiB-like acyl-CoA transferase
VRNDLPPPLLGEHTEGVLADWIGCSPERLSELRRRRIV